jgi:DNA replication protein DnaC
MLCNCGVSKTHLAIVITMAMLKQDLASRFFPATLLVLLMHVDKVGYDLPELISKLDRYRLRVIDDFS